MDDSRIEQFLGREFAQNDKNFLEYSVPREDFLTLLRNKDRQFYLIVAPRGSGKSGLLLMLEDELTRLSGGTSTVIKKYYEEVSFPTGDLTIDRSVQYWLKAQLQWIVAEIGMKIEIPVSPDEVFAVELAERLGMRERTTMDPVRSDEGGSLEALRFIAKRLLEKTRRTFWLLLDEMDDYYSNTSERNFALVGLLQACDAIAKLSPFISIRMTIRPHIHTYLKTNFDVVQKFRDSELPLTWNEGELRNILVRRIQRFDHLYHHTQTELTLQGTPPSRVDQNRENSRVIGRYFEDFDVGFNPGKTSDYRALQTLSLRRPRWMIEYCRLALKASPGDIASTTSFVKAMLEFGRNRIQFLAAEHNSQLPHFARWMESLTAARRSKFGPSEEFRDVIVQFIVRENGEDVASKPVTSLESAEALKIAQALFMLEVVRAHQGAGGADNHRFYNYVDAPELLTTWSARARLTWELHETFARALNIIDNHTFRVAGETRLFGERRAGTTSKRPNRPGSRARRRIAEAEAEAAAEKKTPTDL